MVESTQPAVVARFFVSTIAPPLFVRSMLLVAVETTPIVVCCWPMSLVVELLPELLLELMTLLLTVTLPSDS